MSRAELHDPLRLRRVFSAFPSGVTALAAMVRGRPAGMAANSFTSVSLVPPLAAVCVAHASTTWPVLHSAPRIGVSVLAADQEQQCRQLAARGGDRFAGLSWRTTDSGAILLDGASAWLECSIVQEVAAGDHSIVVLAIHELDADHEVAPLVFHGSQFRRLEPTPCDRRPG
jgi:flavin reductase (DIM6/NTAB) family NADH-FMN oxidoreductase RutF